MNRFSQLSYEEFLKKFESALLGGNQDALTHGFYSQVLDKAHKFQLDEAREVEGIDEEIAILRVKLLAFINE